MSACVRLCIVLQLMIFRIRRTSRMMTRKKRTSEAKAPRQRRFACNQMPAGLSPWVPCTFRVFSGNALARQAVLWRNSLCLLVYYQLRRKVTECWCTVVPASELCRVLILPLFLVVAAKFSRKRIPALISKENGRRSLFLPLLFLPVRVAHSAG